MSENQPRQAGVGLFSYDQHCCTPPPDTYCHLCFVKGFRESLHKRQLVQNGRLSSRLSNSVEDAQLSGGSEDALHKLYVLKVDDDVVWSRVDADDICVPCLDADPSTFQPLQRGNQSF